MLFPIIAATNYIRGLGAIVFFLVTVISSIGYLSYRREKSKHRDQEEAEIQATYQKDENGLYPWEADTDDSPDRVDKNSKRYVYNDRPKRGGW